MNENIEQVTEREAREFWGESVRLTATDEVKHEIRVNGKTWDVFKQGGQEFPILRTGKNGIGYIFYKSDGKITARLVNFHHKYVNFAS
jgi:hypothetical protein